MCGVHGTLNSVGGHDLLNIPSIADHLDIIVIIDSWQVWRLWLQQLVSQPCSGCELRLPMTEELVCRW